jgi:hypothetical protein
VKQFQSCEGSYRQLTVLLYIDYHQVCGIKGTKMAKGQMKFLYLLQKFLSFFEFVYGMCAFDCWGMEKVT